MGSGAEPEPGSGRLRRRRQHRTGLMGLWTRLRRRITRVFGSGPALFRQMGIPMSRVPHDRRGLVIVQIDGLSFKRFQRALREGRLKYTRKLLRKRRLKLHRYLSEIPTSTPAFQAGMFYGDNSGVPGFQFYDKRERRQYFMGSADCAWSVEQCFTRPGLLRGGSVFSCVYNGGAEASLFVFSSLTAPTRWKFALRLWDIALLTLLHLALIARIAVMAVVELAVGLWDCFRRICDHGRIAQELEQVAIRVGLSVIGREMITLGAVIDIHRQMPVVYVNFLGYDEHAHLRGPDSRFARWNLRAIDRCLRRIYLATQTAEREYDFYILSDHGQCATVPFEQLTGETLTAYLQRVTTMSVAGNGTPDRTCRDGLQSANAITKFAQSLPRPIRRPMDRYADYLRRQTLERQDPAHFEPLDLTVVSTGPVAYVYWTSFPEPLRFDDIERMHPGLIETLANHPAVGFVSVRLDGEMPEEGEVLVFARDGRARLTPAGIAEREGALPFDQAMDVAHVVRGIRRLTLLRRAGDLCLWGGGSPSGDVSYNNEYGAHSGWTDDEVESFILAPASVDFDFSKIRCHAEFYDFFMARYAAHWNEGMARPGQEEAGALTASGEGAAPTCKVA